MKCINRITRLQHDLKDKGIAGAMLFFSRDVFYYTGTARPSCLAVFPDDYALFVRSGYEFALTDVFIDEKKLISQRRLENIFDDVKNRLDGKTIGTELDMMPAQQFISMAQFFDGYDIINISPVVLAHRKRKDPDEIAHIKQAAETLHQGHLAVLSTLREGITELQLSAAVEHAHRLSGHEGTFFYRIPDFFMSRGPIASGPNLSKFSGVVYSITGVGLSASLPAGPSARKICQGDPIVIDIPTFVNGYHADQTRTYVLGKAQNKFKDLYACLKEIADDLIEKIRPGISCQEVYRTAVDKASALGVSDAFLNFGNNKSRMIGHGVGLELSEPPVISSYDTSLIQNDYVMAIEMHMMADGVGVMKLEDMIRVGNDGNEILTVTPRDLCEV
jgi:Xaa-Pro aminopeptidase